MYNKANSFIELYRKVLSIYIIFTTPLVRWYIDGFDKIINRDEAMTGPRAKTKVGPNGCT